METGGISGGIGPLLSKIGEEVLAPGGKNYFVGRNDNKLAFLRLVRFFFQNRNLYVFRRSDLYFDIGELFIKQESTEVCSQVLAVVYLSIGCLLFFGNAEERMSTNNDIGRVLLPTGVITVETIRRLEGIAQAGG